MYSIKQIISVLVLLVLIASCSEEQDTSPRVTEDPDVSDFQGVMNDVVNGAPVVVYSNQKQGIFSVFSAQFQNRTLTFELSSEQFPVKLLDNEGNEWDIFGQGRSDANLGQNLELMDQIVGYWFFFPSFYENIELVNGQRIAGAERPERSEDWLINTRNIQYGSFRDGIRSMDAPTFIRMEGKGIVENTFYSELDVDELVTAIEFNGSYRVYPHRILEYHEIVNDFEDELCHTISYCPLTGTSRAWKSKLNGVLTEFGVSGLLYNNNLILYDRQTESHWSQILDVSVNGSLIGERVESKHVIEMKYGELNKLDGDVYLLDPTSGSFSSYATSQYDDYKFNEQVFFPLASTDQTIPAKERVLGVTVDGLTKVYRFSDFQ